MGLFNKKELKRIMELELKLNDLGGLNAVEIMDSISDMEEKLKKINIQVELKNNTLKAMTDEIKNKTNDLNFIDEELNFVEYGFYRPRYSSLTSDIYKDKIKECRNLQKNMVKNKTALFYCEQWLLDNSKSKGKVMNNNNMKMVLLSFNNECDVLISKAKYNNINQLEERIYKSATKIDKINIRNQISIKKEYIELKIEELRLCYECECKKQEEKDIIREQRIQEREEKKLLQEIKEKRKIIEKEKQHYENHLQELNNKLKNSSDVELEYFNLEIKETKDKLLEIKKNLEEIDYRESNKRAGYVYVISNIGTFGEGIYKIGMTRRLDPMERINELSSASVPFKFDVHGMIFSDDAPSLENYLHNFFDDKKVNLVNKRKEFFKVSLKEIEKIVNENFDESIKLEQNVDAEEYKKTLSIINTKNQIIDELIKDY